MNRNYSHTRPSTPDRCLIIIAIAICASVAASNLYAQSGTKNRRSAGQIGSGTRTAANDVGLRGYCPVCVIQMKKWVRGNPQFAVQHDGKTYLFPGSQQKQMFVNNPAKFTPVLGGDCVVVFVEMEKRVSGSLRHAALHDGRIYLFANEKAKSMFLANIDKYASADLALGGKCSVCRIEMNREVEGKPEFTSFYQGLRYQFPGAEQQQMFNQNPSKYRVK